MYILCNVYLSAVHLRSCFQKLINHAENRLYSTEMVGYITDCEIVVLSIVYDPKWESGEILFNQVVKLMSFLLAEGIQNSSVDEMGVAGLESSLPFEADDKMKELPTIKYDQKNVSRVIQWFFCLT